MSDYTAGYDSLDLRAIAPITPDAWAYAEGWLDDTEVIQEARHLADDVGLIPVSHGTASLLTLLTRLVGAGAVVEVGTGTGVSGAALLQGMTADGVLTSIDLEGEHQATTTCAPDSSPAGRSRCFRASVTRRMTSCSLTPTRASTRRSSRRRDACFEWAAW